MAYINFISGQALKLEQLEPLSNGEGQEFVLSFTPVENSVELLRNGMSTRRGKDFKIEGQKITVFFPIHMGRTQLEVRYQIWRVE